MKVFVSGQIEDIPYVRTAQSAFIEAGHKITHDWTTNEGGAKMLGSRKECRGNYPSHHAPIGAQLITRHELNA